MRPSPRALHWGEGKTGVCAPDEKHPANWIGGSFSAPWIDPDYAEQEDQIEKALVESFIQHCKNIGASEILAEGIHVEDKGLIAILGESGFKPLLLEEILTLE